MRRPEEEGERERGRETEGEGGRKAGEEEEEEGGRGRDQSQSFQGPSADLEEEVLKSSLPRTWGIQDAACFPLGSSQFL